MKKAIYRPGYVRKADLPEKETLFGYCPDYIWKSVAYFGVPKKSGRYLVIKKDGTIDEMYCTGNYESVEDARKLFDMAANADFLSDSYIDGREMTDSDLMALYREPYGWWYQFEEWHEYEDWHSDLHIHTRESEQYPLYFLDLNLDEKIPLNGKEIDNVDGTRYFKFDYDGNMIEKEVDN